jgi:hypothetical protein
MRGLLVVVGSFSPLSSGKTLLIVRRPSMARFLFGPCIEYLPLSVRMELPLRSQIMRPYVLFKSHFSFSSCPGFTFTWFGTSTAGSNCGESISIDDDPPPDSSTSSSSSPPPPPSELELTVGGPPTVKDMDEEERREAASSNRGFEGCPL